MPSAAGDETRFGPSGFVMIRRRASLNTNGWASVLCRGISMGEDDERIAGEIMRESIFMPGAVGIRPGN